MFHLTNQANLTQEQKVIVVQNLKAMVAEHMLDPLTVAPGLRPFIGTNLGLRKRVMGKRTPANTATVDEGLSMRVD